MPGTASQNSAGRGLSRCGTVLIFGAAFFTGFVFLPGCASHSERPLVVLITKAEARQADAPATLGPPEDVELGPRILVEKPKMGVPLTSPIDIDIRFLPQGAPVELSTLRVTLLKIVHINLTSRLLPHASVEGIRMSDASIPHGRFSISISISDASGRRSSRTLTVVVK